MKLTEQKIILIIETVFKQKEDSITLATPLEDFAKDSIDIMEFIAILKNKHNVVIEPTEITKLTNVKEIVSYVLSH
ncbi:MAG: acyl carrier protein [bacterium]|nr:acyl carrier protein [bacterium]